MRDFFIIYEDSQPLSKQVAEALRRYHEDVAFEAFPLTLQANGIETFGRFLAGCNGENGANSKLAEGSTQKFEALKHLQGLYP